MPPSSDRAPSELGAPARTRREGASLRGRVAALLAALGLLLLVAVTERSETTDAAWSDPETAGATLSAGVIGPPIPVAGSQGCSYTDRSFTPRWNPPVSPSVTPTHYEYRVLFRGVLPPRVVQDWTVLAPGVRQFTFSQPPALLQLGTYIFEVRSVSGSWTSTVRGGEAPVVQLLIIIGIGSCSWS